MKAIWNGTVIAESDDTVVVENNHYFPESSLKKEYFQPSDHHSICFWKGEASYFDVVIDEKVNKNAAWYYPEPSKEAEKLRDRVAFWNGVQVTP